MRKRLGLVFTIQTAIFTITLGYDQLTQGGIQAFINQHAYSTNVMIISFWVIPLGVIIVLEGLFRFGEWCKDLIDKQYFSWQLSKRKMSKLSQRELQKIISAANQRGLLGLDETEKLASFVNSVESMDVLLLEFLDDPFGVFLHGGVKDTRFESASYYSLFCFIFPFLRLREERIRSSILKLYQLKLITIDFDKFVAKMPENARKIYCTSPLGHKFIFLIKKTSSSP